MILVGHGGRPNREVVKSIAARLSGEDETSVAFVNGKPALDEVLRGVEGRAVVLPVLIAGGRTLDEVEEVLDESGRDFDLARPLLDHPGVVEALRDRLREAMGP